MTDVVQADVAVGVHQLAVLHLCTMYFVCVCMLYDIILYKNTHSHTHTYTHTQHTHASICVQYKNTYNMYVI
jgi:hypothetical protein